MVDYRKLNEITIDDKYPILSMNKILERLGKCQNFSTLDLAKAFHRIEISKEDIQKVAFGVEEGHYEFLRVPFGFKTAPAVQQLMSNILKGYINKICLAYLVFSNSLQEHIETQKGMFQRIKEVNLKVYTNIFILNL